MDVVGMQPPRYSDTSFPVRVDHLTASCADPQPSCWHEDIEIKLIRKGKSIVVIDSQLITAQENEILFVNPYQIHSIPMIEGNSRIYDLIMIDLDFFQKSGVQSMNLRKIFNQNGCHIRNHICDPRLTEILNRLIAACDEAHAYTAPLVQGLLLELFSVLLTEQVSDVPASPVEQKHIKYYHAIEPALDAIHMRYGERLSGEELAEMCSMSMYYFCRVFKRVMGVTPVQYQTEYRLRIADMLLRYENMPISTVARMVGFEDEAYFSRCYKHTRGVSPRQYKNTKEGPAAV